MVPNVLSLCKLHHAAFDGNILGVRPDARLKVRQDVSDEIDGPMLRHGFPQPPRLSSSSSAALRPPSPSSWEERYDAFRAAN